MSPILIRALLLLATLASASAHAQYRLPSPGLSVTEAVETQLAALQRGEDVDLAVVFAFASPGNRAQTGPLPRFIAMIREGYDAMIEHRSAELAPPLLDGDQALQPVRLIDRDGGEHGYVFILRRVVAPDCAGCWFTDGVVPPDALVDPDAAAPPESSV
jgi:hypothetical protein